MKEKQTKHELDIKTTKPVCSSLYKAKNAFDNDHTYDIKSLFEEVRKKISQKKPEFEFKNEKYQNRLHLSKHENKVDPLEAKQIENSRSTYQYPPNPKLIEKYSHEHKIDEISDECSSGRSSISSNEDNMSPIILGPNSKPTDVGKSSKETVSSNFLLKMSTEGASNIEFINSQRCWKF